MAFALVSRSRSKTQGSVKPAPKQKSARAQHPADAQFGFAKLVFQPPTTALPTVPVIQTKLKVGEPDDKFEQEADRVANEVMRMPDGAMAGDPSQSEERRGSVERATTTTPPSVQRLCTECEVEGEDTLQRSSLAFAMRRPRISTLNGPLVARFVLPRLASLTQRREVLIVSSQVDAPRIQRVCRECEEELRRQPLEEDKALQSKEVPGHTPEIPVHLESHINARRTGGRPLPQTLRAFFEPRFGYDFSHVRVHTDENAETSARTINAQAYTVGNDIVFGLGRFDSNATEGRRLLAHELTHVVQQSAGHAPRAVARQPADPRPLEKDGPKVQPQPKPAKCDIGCAQRWGMNTTCSRWGFRLGAHEHAPHYVVQGEGKKMKLIPCCNSWPFSLEEYARNQLGLDGAASCTAAHGKEIATVFLLYFKGKKVEGKPVKVLCSDSLSTKGPGAHYGPKPVSPDACSDKTFKTDKREVIEMSPKAMEALAGKGEVNDRLAVSVCYSGAQEDLCNHNGPGKNRFPEVGHCLTEGCTPPEDTPKLKDTGWPP